MDQEVAKTLGELELKLQELERELTSLGHRGAPVEPPLAPAPGRLVDEVVERDGVKGSAGDPAGGATAGGMGGPAAGLTGSGIAGEPRADAVAGIESDTFGGAAMFGGEEVPAQAGATIERDWTVEVRETAYGEIPTPPSPQGPPSSSIPGPPIPPPAPTPQPPTTTPPGPPPPERPPGPPPPERAPGPPLSTPLGTPPGAPPALSPHSLPQAQPVDVAELARFEQRMRRTLQDLIDEYSRLLSPKPPA